MNKKQQYAKYPSRWLRRTTPRCSFHVCNVVIFLLVATVALCSVVAARHQAVLWWRHGHTESRTWNVVDGVRQAREVLVARLWREVLIERVDVVLFALKVVLLVVAERLAVGTGLVCATMLGKVV